MIAQANSGHSAGDAVASINADDVFFEVLADESSVIQFYSRSFSMASRWLPQDIRSDVEKLYAWCRWCDEAVDSAPNIEVAKARLSYLREDVIRIFDGLSVQHRASNWLAELAQSKGIQKVDALTLLTGMEMDLRSWQVLEEEELIRYCYHVAGVVGLMMCRVMGVHDRAAMKHAVDLGIAMQLTNIARDVAEDWRMGRGYLPKSWIDLGTDRSPTNESVRVSVERILHLAEEYFQSGMAGLSYLPSSCRSAICLAATAYREIGREILRRECRVMDGRIAISRARLAWISGKAWTGNLVSSLALKTLGSNFAGQLFNYPLTSVSGDVIMNDARYLVYLGLSLTSFMASALFVMISIHPKDPSYAALPIVYAVGCLLIGVVTNILAVRAASRPIPVRVSAD